MSFSRRLPISARHAYALAFDLAVRRDAVQSLVVPFLLQAPWFVALALLPPLDQARGRMLQVTIVGGLALLGQCFSWLLVSAMLRYRARSVFNTPAGTAPAAAADCYASALTRVPWLYVTEFARNASFFLGSLFLFLPGLWLGFKLSMATEDVVLGGHGISAAFSHSFQLTEARFERWLEMIVLSVVIVLTLWFFAAALYIAAPGPGPDFYFKVFLPLAFAILPVIQYAWTFFYLRLVEIEPAVSRESGEPERSEVRARQLPAPTGTPRLKLVEPRRESSEEARSHQD